MSFNYAVKSKVCQRLVVISYGRVGVVKIKAKVMKRSSVYFGVFKFSDYHGFFPLLIAYFTRIIIPKIALVKC